MKLAFTLIDRLVRSPSRTNLMALDKILALGIPFNAPHGFSIRELSRDSVVIRLPNRKLNHNHLGGVHACAMATVGEFCAGMAIITSFGISRYRLIMSEMHVKYAWQGRTELEGTCLPGQIDREAVEKALAAEGKHSQTLVTLVRDKNGKEVATVTTTWQIKNWEQVRTKG